jgi:hypothetical protein
MKISDKLMLYPKTFSDIILYYDGKELHNSKINEETVNDFILKHNIESNPCFLFRFFDRANIKIAIIPVIQSEDWSYRIFNKDNILMMNDYTSRNEATLASLERAVIIYNTRHE